MLQSEMMSDRESMKMSAVILCGGRSRRMGADKAELMIGGRTILRRLTENLQPLGDLWLSVCSAADHPESPLPKAADRFADCGPLAGLEAALSVCSGELLFVTPVDVPFADAALALELAQRLAGEPETDALLVEDAAGRKQYLLGVYRKRVHPKLLYRLQEGGKDALRVRDFLAEIKPRYVKAEELTDGAFKTRSCNTAEEYLELKAMAESRETGKVPEAP